ncbi:MAG: DUF899 domain-containing protein [Ilumatobacteraceae bacterium]
MTIDHEIATRDEWTARRVELLKEEKALSRRLDEVARQRRALPWVAIDKAYVFDTTEGKRSLAELFDGRSQLLVYHFMYGPDWKEGCPSCSFWADNYDGISVHLAHRDVSFVVVSRAPLSELLRYQQRMGWTFKWVSSAGTDFNTDFGVSDVSFYNFAPLDDVADELPGLSAFIQVDGQVFHTYSAYQRGLDIFNAAYQMLDMTPKGRDEDSLPWKAAWLRRHDQYDD